MSRVMKRILFQVETYKGTEGLCNMICSQLNNEDINFGNNFQITVTKRNIFTDVIIDYMEDER